MIRKSDITALIADDAMAASYQSLGAYRSGLISIIQSEATTPGVINNDSAASEIKWPMRSRERVWMAGMGEHGTIDLGHLWNKDTGEIAAIFIGPPDTPEAITLAFPCQSWAARVFNALAGEQGPVDQAEPPAAQPVLAPKHEGLRVDASGILGRVEGPEKYFASHMLSHLEELAARYYGGDVAVVDKFLQLYCLDDKRPKALTLPAACTVREEEPAEYRVDGSAEQQVEQEPVGEIVLDLDIGGPNSSFYADLYDRMDVFLLPPGTKLYAGPVCQPNISPAPPAAQDVSGLVEALKAVLYSNELGFLPVTVQEAVKTALSAHWEQQGGDV